MGLCAAPQRYTEEGVTEEKAHGTVGRSDGRDTTRQTFHQPKQPIVAKWKVANVVIVTKATVATYQPPSTNLVTRQTIVADTSFFSIDRLSVASRAFLYKKNVWADRRTPKSGNSSLVLGML